MVLLDAVKKPDEREWYMRQTVENGWSRNVLVHQIDSGLHRRQGKALTNFKRTLPAPQSDLAQQIVKDPYTFEFLSLSVDMQERDLERGLLEHLRLFILELGKGFAFVGSQYHLEVGLREFQGSSRRRSSCLLGGYKLGGKCRIVRPASRGRGG